MNANADTERLLSASELEMVAATQEPQLGQLPVEEMKSLVKRLRQAHDRAKDIAARQQREMRGKAEPKGAEPAKDNAGTIGKAQALFEAIHRLDAEMSRREQSEAATAEPTQADLARHALETKMSSQKEHHPDPGRSASEGMHVHARQTPAKVGTTQKEVGRVSQAGKVAQTRKDGK